MTKESKPDRATTYAATSLVLLVAGVVLGAASSNNDSKLLLGIAFGLIIVSATMGGASIAARYSKTK